jgi:hypothetical protein
MDNIENSQPPNFRAVCHLWQDIDLKICRISGAVVRISPAGFNESLLDAFPRLVQIMFKAVKLGTCKDSVRIDRIDSCRIEEMNKVKRYETRNENQRYESFGTKTGVDGRLDRIPEPSGMKIIRSE